MPNQTDTLLHELERSFSDRGCNASSEIALQLLVVKQAVALQEPLHSRLLTRRDRLFMLDGRTRFSLRPTFCKMM